MNWLVILFVAPGFFVTTRISRFAVVAAQILISDWEAQIVGWNQIEEVLVENDSLLFSQLRHWRVALIYGLGFGVLGAFRKLVI